MKYAYHERQHLAKECAGSFRTNAKTDSRAQALGCYFQSFHGAFAIRPIDGDDIHEAHSIAEDRRFQEFLLSHHPHAPARKSEQRRRVEIRPMVRDEDVSLGWVQMRLPSHFHLDAG